MKVDAFYPAILFPADTAGPAGCVVPGPNINAGGETDEAALQDAVAILGDLLSEGGVEPSATVADVMVEIAELGGQLVWLPAIKTDATA